LPFHQQAADELGGNLLSGAAEEELGRCWVVVVAMGVAVGRPCITSPKNRSATGKK